MGRAVEQMPPRTGQDRLRRGARMLRAHEIVGDDLRLRLITRRRAAGRVFFVDRYVSKYRITIAASQAHNNDHRSISRAISRRRARTVRVQSCARAPTPSLPLTPAAQSGLPIIGAQTTGADEVALTRAQRSACVPADLRRATDRSDTAIYWCSASPQRCLGARGSSPATRALTRKVRHQAGDAGTLMPSAAACRCSKALHLSSCCCR